MTDINKPIENPKLSELFEIRRTTPPAQHNSVNNQIAEEIALHAKLLAVISVSPNAPKAQEDGTAVFEKDTVISFSMFSDPNENTFMPVFTDWPSLYAGELYKDGNVQTLVVTFDDIYAITHGSAGAVVNPFTDNFVITPRNLAQMKQQKDITENGVSKQVIEKDTKVQIGDPKEFPAELAQAVRSYAENSKAINAVWLKLMIKDGEQSYLLIVDHNGDEETVFRGIAQAAVPHIHNGMYLDMLGYNSESGRSAAKGEPVYRRKKRGLFS